MNIRGEQSMATVANVNKQKSTRSGTKKRKVDDLVEEKLPSRAGKAIGKMKGGQKAVTGKSPKPNKTPRKMLADREVTAQHDPDGSESEITFGQVNIPDDGNFLQMHVQADEDNFLTDSEDEADQSDMESDDSKVQHSETEEQGDQSQAEMSLPADNDPEMTEQDYRARLADLEDEVERKTTELHQLIEGTSSKIRQLHQGSVKTSQARPSTSKRADSRRKGMAYPNRVEHQRADNINSNAIGLPMPELTRSIETIYKNAVEVKDTFSSEEALELSDESLEQNNSIVLVESPARSQSRSPMVKNMVPVS